jgi:hypothetical protein
MNFARILPALAVTLLSAPGAFAAIDGLRVEEDGNEIASVSGAVVSGEISVPPGETSGALLVTFTDGGSDYVPVASDSLVFSIADPGTATGASLGGFSLEVTGVLEDMTTITFGLRNNGLIYEAPPIELHVEEAHAEAEGLVLTHRGAEVVVVWQGLVTGSLQVPLGGSTDDVTIEFLGPAGTPEEAERFVPEEGHFGMGLTVAPGSIAAGDSVGHFIFRVDGVSLGTAQLVVDILHEGHSDFTSPDIPVVVLPASATDAPVIAAVAGLALEPAWPNPFRVGTRIAYSLPQEGRVDLGVFDVRGRRVATLVTGNRPAGSHEATWTPSEAQPGVYFVRLATPRDARSAKVVLER